HRYTPADDTRHLPDALPVLRVDDDVHPWAHGVPPPVGAHHPDDATGVDHPGLTELLLGHPLDRPDQGRHRAGHRPVVAQTPPADERGVGEERRDGGDVVLGLDRAELQVGHGPVSTRSGSGSPPNLQVASGGMRRVVWNVAHPVITGTEMFELRDGSSGFVLGGWVVAMIDQASVAVSYEVETDRDRKSVE